jgi:hypothetical protein
MAANTRIRPKGGTVIKENLVHRMTITVGIILLLTGGAAAQSGKPIKLTPKDYFEIYQLYAAYSNALDIGDGAGRVGTFTPDGTFSWVASKHQPESMDVLKKRTDAYEHKPHPVAGHLLTNIHITPTPEGADGSCYALLGGGKPDAQGHYIADPAFYQDKLVKTAAGWRFKSREVWIPAAEGVWPNEGAKKLTGN